MSITITIVIIKTIILIILNLIIIIIIFIFIKVILIAAAIHCLSLTGASSVLLTMITRSIASPQNTFFLLSKQPPQEKIK